MHIKCHYKYTKWLNEKWPTTDPSKIIAFVVDKSFWLKKCYCWVIQRKMQQIMVPNISKLKVCTQQATFKELAKTQLNFDMEKKSLTRVKRRLKTINWLAITNGLLIFY